MLRWGYQIPFSTPPPPLSPDPIPFVTYPPSSFKGKALLGEVRSLIDKGAVELAPPSPDFCSRLFVVWKTSGSWCPMINLSFLNGFVLQTLFKMEISLSVLRAVRRHDWMVSIDLKDAYLQVLVYSGSRRFLRFVTCGRVYQFKALCFGLSIAPQVFTRNMALVLSFLHSLGVRILCYLDDWLILASSLSEALWARDAVLDLCHQLGMIINLDKSYLTPSHSATYLGMVLRIPILRAFPAPKRVSALRSQIEEFLSYDRQSVVLWRSLLSHLSSLCHLVPGGPSN